MRGWGWILLALLLTGAGTAQGAFRALLVGIDYRNRDLTDPVHPLCGAVKDVEDMYRLMTEDLGIPAEQIRVLKEQEATRDRILKAFREWLIAGTAPGDRVFFQFSGHGLQVVEAGGGQSSDFLKAGREQDWYRAEALAPYDLRLDIPHKRVERAIRDSELKPLLDELADRRVSLFLDSCFSAGATRQVGWLDSELPTRVIQLPWAQEVPQVLKLRPLVARPRGLAGIVDESWHPPYDLFAATHYFQKAYEYPPVSCGDNGAFTHAVVELLHAGPDQGYSNAEVLAYAADFLSDRAQIEPGLQQPQYYGPLNGESALFPLLAASTPRLGEFTLPAVVLSGIEPMAVRITGDGALRPELERGLRQVSFARPARTGDVPLTLALEDGRVSLYSIGGRPLRQRLQVDSAMQALEHQYVVRQLANLANPAAPFQVELWLDEKGKRRFRQGDRVNLYYQVAGLPSGSKAYLTLLNVAPDGTVSILYPGSRDTYQGPGSKPFLNAEVETDRIHRIPQLRVEAGQDALKPGQNLAVDLRIRLERGQEYFKAIVTSRPIEAEDLGLARFHRLFTGADGRNFVSTARDQVLASGFWAAGGLEVEVE